MTSSPRKTALIIGATGSFGGHAAIALIKRGWRIRALARDPEAAARKSGARTPIEWVKGDAMSAADVLAASDGADVIVHGANPPGYKNWRGLAVPMLANTIAAAVARRARIVLPGNVYNFAPDAGPAIGEDAPQAPATRKGKIRVEMEATLRAAASQGARVLVLRAGDFFGPAAPNSGLGWLISRRGGRVGSLYAPGAGSVGHDYAYLPDLAETLARLLEREAELADFDVFHFRGHWLERNEELGAAIRRVTGQPKLPIRQFPWIMVYALSPFVEMFRELAEMRYLWKAPIGLDNAKLVAFLGEEPHTPLDAALRATLADMGCLEEAAYAPASRASSAMAPTM
jgi:nucleoside-diphosphate-sugar epimerase